MKQFCKCRCLWKPIVVEMIMPAEEADMNKYQELCFMKAMDKR